jgi:hypothetical protein
METMRDNTENQDFDEYLYQYNTELYNESIDLID